MKSMDKEPLKDWFLTIKHLIIEAPIQATWLSVKSCQISWQLSPIGYMLNNLPIQSPNLKKFVLIKFKSMQNDICVISILSWAEWIIVFGVFLKFLSLQFERVQFSNFNSHDLNCNSLNSFLISCKRYNLRKQWLSNVSWSFNKKEIMAVVWLIFIFHMLVSVLFIHSLAKMVLWKEKHWYVTFWCSKLIFAFHKRPTDWQVSDS